MILKYFRQKNWSKKLAFLTQNKAKCINLIITLVFEKKRQFFRRKLAIIAKNCDHNFGLANSKIKDGTGFCCLGGSQA
jgi:hypothetical protein